MARDGGGVVAAVRLRVSNAKDAAAVKAPPCRPPVLEGTSSC